MEQKRETLEFYSLLLNPQRENFKRSFPINFVLFPTCSFLFGYDPSKQLSLFFIPHSQYSPINIFFLKRSGFFVYIVKLAHCWLHLAVGSREWLGRDW